jgi:hypothetical protein
VTTPYNTYVARTYVSVTSSNATLEMACPCKSNMLGGYRATRKNKNILARYRAGKSIGFTATASLKAKGLIPRTSRKLRGKRVLGPKYK